MCMCIYIYIYIHIHVELPRDEPSKIKHTYNNHFFLSDHSAQRTIRSIIFIFLEYAGKEAQRPEPCTSASHRKQNLYLSALLF